MTESVGYLAGVLTVAAFLPQVLRAWRTRQTRDLSLGMLALLIAAGTLWMVYGVLIGDWPVIATNIGMVTLNLAILTVKVRSESAPAPSVVPPTADRTTTSPSS